MTTRPDDDRPPIDDDQLYARIHRLVSATFESPDAPEAAELRRLLSEDKAAQQLYTTYMHDTAALRSASPANAEQVLSESERPHTTAPAKPRKAMRAWIPVFGALAAGLLILVAKPAISPITSSDGPAEVAAGMQETDGHAVATITRLIDVEWPAGAEPLGAFSRLSVGQHIELVDGQIEVVFDSGVELLITGKSEALIESPLRVISSLGTFSARVGERGKGFTIDTPSTRVIDLGTAFGVTIRDSGETEVAVFEGVVDLDTRLQSGEPDASTRKRLVQGEALKVDTEGHYSRIVSISSNQFPTAGQRRMLTPLRQQLITAVEDNIRDPESANFYRIVPGGLFEDAPAFVDRGHEWNGIDESGLPRVLLGADYVMPFNNDKFLEDLEVTVRIAAPSRVYLFFDDNMPVPDWLAEGFVDTGLDIGLDQAEGKFTHDSSLGRGGGVSIDDRLSVWRRDVEGASELRLGSVDPPADKELGWNMFGVAAVPLLDALAASGEGDLGEAQP